MSTNWLASMLTLLLLFFSVWFVRRLPDPNGVTDVWTMMIAGTLGAIVSSIQSIMPSSESTGLPLNRGMVFCRPVIGAFAGLLAFYLILATTKTTIQPWQAEYLLGFGFGFSGSALW